MPHVFISYAKEDTRELALDLADALNGLDGITAWVDRSLRAGRSWELQIQTEIDRCDWMVVLYSPDINRHKEGKEESYVLTEIAYALRYAKKPIVPVMAKATIPPLSLINAHYIDYTIDGVTLDDLVAAVCGEMGVTLADPTPKEPRFSPSPSTGRGEGQPKPVTEQSKPKPTAEQNRYFDDADKFLGEINKDTEVILAEYLRQDSRAITNRLWTPIIETFSVQGLDLEMCLVPEGVFLMGSDAIEDEDEKPIHQQILRKKFWIGKYHVTAEQWRKARELSKDYIDEPASTHWYAQDENDLPILGVTWYQCAKFAEWLGTGWKLPSELEWEYAARGPTSWRYVWGNHFDEQAEMNFMAFGKTPRRVGIMPFHASWVGAEDMCGSIWEWTRSKYRPYPYEPHASREVMDDSKTSRVLRGGLRGNLRIGARATLRKPEKPDKRGLIGFRLVYQEPD